MQQIMGNEDVFESDGLKMMTFPLIKSNSLGGFPERKKKKVGEIGFTIPFYTSKALQTSFVSLYVKVCSGCQEIQRKTSYKGTIQNLCKENARLKLVIQHVDWNVWS